MKKLDEPSNPFNISPPSYQEISNIIKRMKSGSSACPYDKISILIDIKTVSISPNCTTSNLNVLLGREICSQNLEIIGFTILIHKQDSPQIPSNFRPITLQPVPDKIYSSLIRNRLYSFMTNNNYIETKIQKGFWEGVSGTIEHTELLTHIINHARNNQRHLVVTLLDLKKCVWRS